MGLFFKLNVRTFTYVLSFVFFRNQLRPNTTTHTSTWKIQPQLTRNVCLSQDFTYSPDRQEIIPLPPMNFYTQNFDKLCSNE